MTDLDLSIDGLSVQREWTRGADRASVLDRLDRGELIIVRQYLQRVNLMNACNALVLEAVHHVCGKKTKVALRKVGISRLHLHVDKNQLGQVYGVLRNALAGKMPFVTANLFRQLGAADPFFVHSASLIRLQYPHEATRGLQQEFKRAALGKLHPHGPHHDHYQNVPFNALNTWVALTDIDRSNGMLVYLDVWGRNLDKGDEIVADQYRLGRPHWVEMKAGDALIFHSNHLHSSQLNSSKTTRVVLTNRVCLDHPIYPDLSKPQQYFHSAAFPMANDFGGLFAAPGFVGDPSAVVPPHAPDPATLARVQSEFAARHAAGQELIHRDDPVGEEEARAQLAEGRIIALDDRTCLARINGQDYEFPRRCPHEAADLAKGFVEDGKVVCPFHGARLCPSSGQCEGIASMKFRARKSEPIPA